MIRNSFILICISIILLCTSCNNLEKQYQFPLKVSDIEKVFHERELSWLIEDEYSEDLQSIYTLKNYDNITFGISTKTNDYGNILNMNWSLPNNLTEEKFNEFYHTELPRLFKLVGIFYGNSIELNKSLNEFSEYYLIEDYEGEIYWTKRIGEDHLMIEIKPWSNSQDNRNRLGTLMVTNSSAYENYLKLLDESWRNIATIDGIEIIESTVEEVSKFTQDDNNEEPQPKHFIIKGRLEDVKEIKNVPESLKNIESHFLKSNKDRYLIAKLIDKTGNIDVFLQSTSLNDSDLGRERKHNVVLLFYENTPVIVVRNSILIE